MPSHAHRCLQTIRLPTFCRWWATSVPSDILVSLEWLCWWRLRLRYLDVWCLRVEMLPIITLRAIRTNGTWGHLTIMICVFPACERWAFYPNLMRWRNAALNWRMTDVQESSEQQNGIKDSSSKVNRWLRLPRVSIMPLVFEGYPWLLYSCKLSELRNGNIHLKRHPRAPSILGSHRFLRSRWPFITMGEFRRSYLNNNSTDTAANSYVVFSVRQA